MLVCLPSSQLPSKRRHEWLSEDARVAAYGLTLREKELIGLYQARMCDYVVVELANAISAWRKQLGHSLDSDTLVSISEAARRAAKQVQKEHADNVQAVKFVAAAIDQELRRCFDVYEDSCDE